MSTLFLSIKIKEFRMRPNNRENHQPRPIKITRNYTKHAEGSVLVEFGDTKVLCTASVDESVPRFLPQPRLRGVINKIIPTPTYGTKYSWAY